MSGPQTVPGPGAAPGSAPGTAPRAAPDSDGAGGAGGPGDAAAPPEPAPPGPGSSPATAPSRFWSARRAPAALLALILLCSVGLLLYDIASVRADRPATAWRTRLADELAGRTLDDPWVVVAACAAVLTGLWLVVLAVTPGLRNLMPMRGEAGVLRAAIERHAAAVALRDRALEVSGVQSVRVVVGRRRVRAEAQAHFRDLADVRSDLNAVLGDSIRRMELAHPPALAVQVRRPPKR
ncbi:DUF6286 domain-containing protein [Streptomyces aidingensis]|uniref:DUF6286 domain-containing protein n=1 Tax=Streptomyces aidingensis TaxID=910347 RepID=A0A1I1M045_9ACTN|nr:DUF6286 domain-containing protein [Streptomyces aidingensis]SFC78734.1 hypothetical protein SAMN05421773_10640 [Streptomyces aidingensis]